MWEQTDFNKNGKSITLSLSEIVSSSWWYHEFGKHEISWKNNWPEACLANVSANSTERESLKLIYFPVFLQQTYIEYVLELVVVTGILFKRISFSPRK